MVGFSRATRNSVPMRPGCAYIRAGASKIPISGSFISERERERETQPGQPDLIGIVAASFAQVHSFISASITTFSECNPVHIEPNLMGPLLSIFVSKVIIATRHRSRCFGNVSRCPSRRKQTLFAFCSGWWRVDGLGSKSSTRAF